VLTLNQSSDSLTVQATFASTDTAVVPPEGEKLGVEGATDRVGDAPACEMVMLLKAPAWLVKYTRAARGENAVFCW
jgi:hypothetical protein